MCRSAGSRNWQDKEVLDALIDQLQVGQLTHKQALMQARKLEATTPDNLKTHNFIANRLWALGLQDEAAEVYEQAFRRAQAHVPKGYTGQITWSEVDNRSFLRLAHGTLLGLMHRREKSKRRQSRHGTGPADARVVPHGQHWRAFFVGKRPATPPRFQLVRYG